MYHDLSDIKIDYNGTPLVEKNLPEDPIQLFETWFNDVSKTYNSQANAMVLATHGKSGFPQSRVVLLKGFSEEGFQFFTNYNSPKARGINKNNKVSLTFYWPELERQVHVEGTAEKTSSKVSEDYFNSRPLESRISAVISDQSKKIPSREYLENKGEEYLKQLDGEAPKRPEYWGGYIVKPLTIEFWQGRPFRLHDRIYYKLKNDKWTISRLAP